tara:strand:+ start:227 stop:403 length:177 start_codon:yes stop_codon:yes gene_type:complete
MKKESIEWLIYLINYRKTVMADECDLSDIEVAECVKAETKMADKVLNELKKLMEESNG